MFCIIYQVCMYALRYMIVRIWSWGKCTSVLFRGPNWVKICNSVQIQKNYIYKLWTLLWEQSSKYFKVMKNEGTLKPGPDLLCQGTQAVVLTWQVAVFSFCHVSHLNEYAYVWQIDDLLQCSRHLLTEVLIEPLFAGILSIPTVSFENSRDFDCVEMCFADWNDACWFHTIAGELALSLPQVGKLELIVLQLRLKYSDQWGVSIGSIQIGKVYRT